MRSPLAITLARLVVAVVGAAAQDARADDNVQLGLSLPPGFELTEFADAHLANDIYSMTLDPRGRIVVAGRGYIRILVDDDGDGRADRAIEFSDGPRDGAMGLLWEADTLYATGDGGLCAYRDADGDGRADGPSTLVRAMKTGGEHHAHDIRRGPDGWLYVLCGNMTGIDRSFAELATSPLCEPVAGCVVRFTPDLHATEIVADGFRNAYRMDFGPDGELFTFDSDNERCVSLPWYEPTRLYHVMPGGHYGWQAPQRAEWWRLPACFPDTVAPVARLGRGSPTGVAYYGHTRFPEPYRNGLFLADWTFGRVYFVRLDRSGASYTGEPGVFLASVGENGFAPTDLRVHPETGDLWISIGGRGTRGGVYRVRYNGSDRNAPGAGAAPRAASSRRAAADDRGLLEQARSADPFDRRHALDEIYRRRERFGGAALADAVRSNWADPDRYVRLAASRLVPLLSAGDRRALRSKAISRTAQATYALGACDSDPAGALACATRLLADPDAGPQRLAAVRVVQLALGRLPAERFRGTVWEGYAAGLPASAAVSGDASAGGVRSPSPASSHTERRPLTQRNAPSPFPLPRVTQERGGEGTASAGEQKGSGAGARSALARLFPSGDAELDRELARTLGMLGDDGADTLRRMLDRVSDGSDPIDDIHYLIVAARLNAARTSGQTRQVAHALLALDAKIAARGLHTDRNWPLRVAELYAGLAEKHGELDAAILADPAFGRAGHVLFTQSRGFDRRAAAEIFLRQAAGDADYEWTAGLVDLVARLPDPVWRPVLGRHWENFALRDAILRALARAPRTEDRAKFIDGLGSPQLATVRLCLDALDRLPPADDPGQALALVRGLRRLRDSPEERALRVRTAELLEHTTGQSGHGADPAAWTAWFIAAYPEWAPRLAGPDGVDRAAWNGRLARIGWSAGGADAGRAVYERVGCAACHAGGHAVGPDLRGVARRFSHEDLFTAIIEPSRDVSSRYQTTLIATSDGKVYQGMIVYEAVDGMILQTGPDAVVRISDSQIAERRVTEASLMPAGLLDKLTDAEIADLYAYLRELP